MKVDAVAGQEIGCIGSKRASLNRELMACYFVHVKQARENVVLIFLPHPVRYKAG